MKEFHEAGKWASFVAAWFFMLAFVEVGEPLDPAAAMAAIAFFLSAIFFAIESK